MAKDSKTGDFIKLKHTSQGLVFDLAQDVDKTVFFAVDEGIDPPVSIQTDMHSNLVTKAKTTGKTFINKQFQVGTEIKVEYDVVHDCLRLSWSLPGYMLAEMMYPQVDVAIKTIFANSSSIGDTLMALGMLFEQHDAAKK